eukprot:1155534-Amphidinium_carterae.1
MGGSLGLGRDSLRLRENLLVRNLCHHTGGDCQACCKDPISLHRQAERKGGTSVDEGFNTPREMA